MVFTAEFSEQAEVPSEVPVAFQVGLVLAVLVADDPGLGFHATQKAELVVLVEYAQIGAGRSVVTAAQVVVDFQVGGGHGEGLGAGCQSPASTGTALQVGGEYAVGFGVSAAAAEADLPGQWREELVARREGADFHAGQLFNLYFVVVRVKASVQAQELELCSATVACGRVKYIVVGGA